MAEDEATNGGVAVAEPEQAMHDAAEAETKPKRGLFGFGKSKDEADEVEHEIELMTPFGKLELEFEPTSSKQRREQKQKAKEAAEAAKRAAKEQAKALKEQAKALEKGTKSRTKAVKEAATAASKKKGGGKGKIALILLAIALVGGGIAVAYWLFGRKPEEMESIPSEYRSDEYAPATEPEGFVAKTRHRIRHAVRAGQQASREAQIEQQQRYEGMTQGG